jgi:hypothetical protein
MKLSFKLNHLNDVKKLALFLCLCSNNTKLNSFNTSKNMDLWKVDLDMYMNLQNFVILRSLFWNLKKKKKNFCYLKFSS